MYLFKNNIHQHKINTGDDIIIHNETPNSLRILPIPGG
jgi:hypothetical protein